MKFFTARQRLEQLAAHTKLLVCALMCSVIFQAVSGLLMQANGPGWTTESVSRYFRGDQVESNAASPAADPFGLQGDVTEPVSIALPKSFPALLEVAHWHLAIIPILVFLVLHCAALTYWGQHRFWFVVYGITAVSAVGVIAAPFLITYHSAAWAWFQLASVWGLDGGLILGAGLVMVSCMRKIPAR